MTAAPEVQRARCASAVAAEAKAKPRDSAWDLNWAYSENGTPFPVPHPGGVSSVRLRNDEDDGGRRSSACRFHLSGQLSSCDTRTDAQRALFCQFASSTAMSGGR